MLENQFEDLRRSTLAAFASAGSLDTLEEARVEVLGRKGTLAQISKEFGKLTPDERARLGKLLNSVKQDLETEYAAKKDRFEKAALAEQLAGNGLMLRCQPVVCGLERCIRSRRFRPRLKICSRRWALRFCMGLKWNRKNIISTRLIFRQRIRRAICRIRFGFRMDIYCARILRRCRFEACGR